MKSYDMAVKKYHKDKDELIQTHRKVAKKVPGVNQVSKSDTGEVVTPPVDDVTKYGQLMAINHRKKDSI